MRSSSVDVLWLISVLILAATTVGYLMQVRAMLRRLAAEAPEQFASISDAATLGSNSPAASVALVRFLLRPKLGEQLSPGAVGAVRRARMLLIFGWIAFVITLILTVSIWRLGAH